ncbi:B12-binding domain-containing protein, partial [Candidatus Bathyarchaeota archaeon]|nr:B12-binding domain-containing protein [Candidatus Bathyarchaeota archaeon]
MPVNLEELSKLVIDGDTDAIKSAVKNAINDGADPLEIVDKGLAKGIRTVGEKYGKGEIFLTELLMG